MYSALRELFKEEIEEEKRKKYRAGLDEGFTQAIVECVKDGQVPLDIGAGRLHITVDEMKKLVAQN